MSAYNVTFNGYTLQNATIKTRVIQHTDLPNKVVQAQPRGRRDGMTVVDVRYSSREITVEGTLVQTNRQTLVDSIDEMKKKLRATSGELDIDYGDNTRRYFATVESIELPEDFYNVDIINYKIRFLCADPFGYPTASGIFAGSAVTSMLYDLTITVSGTVMTDPVLHLVVNSDNEMETFEFTNMSTGESLLVSKPGSQYFAAGDQIVINGIKKEVELNASGIDYTGIFPTIDPDTTPFRVSVQGVAANYTPIIRYLPAYL